MKHLENRENRDIKKSVQRVLGSPHLKKALSRHPYLPKEEYQKFFEVFLHQIPSEILLFLSDDDLAEFALGRFDFIYEARISWTGDLTKTHKVEILESPREPWMINFHTVEIIMPDAHFLKDSLMEFFHTRGLAIKNLIHSVLPVKRENNKVVQIGYHEEPGVHSDPGNEFYALFILEYSRNFNAKELQKEIEKLLVNIAYVTYDFQPMKELLKGYRTTPSRSDFIDWVNENNFVYLGIKNKKRRLGLFRNRELEKVLEAHARPGNGKLAFYRTEYISQINRREKVILITMDDLLFAGMFTRKANSTSSWLVPVLRERMERLIEKNKPYWSSLEVQDFIYTFNIFPLEYRFCLPPEKFVPFSDLVNEGRLKIKSMVRLRVIGENRAFLLVLWPLPEYSEEIPERLKNYINSKQMSVLGEVNHVLSSLMFHLYELDVGSKVVREIKNSNECRNFEELLLEHLEGWHARIEKLLKLKFNLDQVLRYNDEIIPALPELYTDQNSLEEGVQDILILDSNELDEYKITAYNRPGAKVTFLKIFSPTAATLSRLVPVLSNFGLNVLQEEAYVFSLKNQTIYCSKFHLTYEDKPIVDFQKLNKLCDALELILENRASSEPLNSLLITTDLNIHQIELLKALVSYLIQVRKGFSRVLVKRILQIRSHIAVALVDLFELRFVPRLKINPKEKEATAAIEKKLGLAFPFAKELDSFIASKEEKTENLTLDTLVHSEVYEAIKKIVSAIIRTSYFTGSETISFKVDTLQIPYVPEPSPMFELWVYHAHFEGVHLRGGKVARGGLRWSNRQDDFRTEVWGLWKTQVLKNSTIVPTGSKGGFVIKYLPNLSESAIWAYRLFIRSILELTDNHKAKASAQEAQKQKLLSCFDEKDSYLVVAADKGTATFSDYANEIAVEEGFWLGDAFASGGKNGYSHKELGITAKGAWESARWHFYEKGQDPEVDSIQVVAIGDMGGDVFGNGMILSSSILLVAAFNHKHIFIDPAPDAAQSYKERKRLFESVGGWDQYNKKLISRGGGVFRRDAASIELSSAAADSLGAEAGKYSGEELIKVVLRAPVDMIFNGGIGTYIKSSHESHQEVDDMANDAVRIDACDAGAAMIVEGGNLGVSPEGRLEYSNRGGVINTDAIDNSAGVDLSDHEVNLKILFNMAMDAGLLAGMAQRNKILKNLAALEVNLVLQNNFRQNWAIAHQVSLAPRDQGHLLDFLDFLIAEKKVKEDREGIPSRAFLRDFLAEKNFLPRPFLSLMLGYARIYYRERYQCIDPFIKKQTLRQYFPSQLKKYASLFEKHPLAEEIIKMSIVNHVVDHAGIHFLELCRQNLGLTPTETVDAYLFAEKYLGLDNSKLKEYLPDGTTRKFAKEITFETVIMIKQRIDKALYRLIEMQVLFPSARSLGPFQEKSNFAKIELLSKIPAKDQAFTCGIPGLNHFPAEALGELVQIFHVELRYVLHYMADGLGSKERQNLLHFYLHSGVRALKKALYRTMPANYWENQAIVAIKRNFWNGMLAAFVKGKGGPEFKIDIEKEVKKIMEQPGGHIAALGGLVGYIFS